MLLGLCALFLCSSEWELLALAACSQHSMNRSKLPLQPQHLASSFPQVLLGWEEIEYRNLNFTVSLFQLRQLKGYFLNVSGKHRTRLFKQGPLSSPRPSLETDPFPLLPTYLFTCLCLFGFSSFYFTLFFIYLGAVRWTGRQAELSSSSSLPKYPEQPVQGQAQTQGPRSQSRSSMWMAGTRLLK